MSYRYDQSYDSGDDSDIQEIAVITPPKSSSSSSTTRRDKSGNNNDYLQNDTNRRRPLPIAKRRKSSPQMDPIPSYTPTPLHLLEQRSRERSSAYPTQTISSSYAEYNPTPFYSGEQADDNHESPPASPGEYTPLLEPSRHVISCDTSHNTPQVVTNQTATSRQMTLAQTSSVARAPPTSTSSRPASARDRHTPRPVSSALAQAVSRRRSSLVGQDKSLPGATLAPTSAPASTQYAQQPVMWSPKLPSEIKAPPAQEPAKDLETGEDYSKYQSLNAPKQRVARKPTIPRDSRNRPRLPQGISKKVPQPFRIKYLDVIINEYLNTGHKEDESYQEALKDEQAIASRAANKNIYVNLVAGLKKKIREKAGISTKPPDDDPKYVNGNKVVSHEDIITGKVIGTFSIERKRKMSDPSELNEVELYDRLSRYIMPLDELEAYGYPRRDPDNPDLRLAPLGKDGNKLQLRPELASSYTCERCTKVYRVNELGMQLETTGKCIFHPGHLWNERINRALEKRYSCCKGDSSAGGCSSNPYHIHRGELEMVNYQYYVETQPKPERDPNRHGIYALDCEMCYTTVGLELTRVTVIDYKLEVVYEKLVKPGNPVLDYNTKFSGIRPGDLDDIQTSLFDVQRDLLELFSDKTILVGHSLDSDMKALKIFHRRFIDTAQLFPHKRGLPYKRALRTLMVENLRMIIQEDAGHDSKEDACAAFKLVLWKAKTDVPAKATK